MALYGSVQGYKGRRNCFDLSFSKTFDGDIGIIYPLMCEEVLPGDIWKCNNQVMVKFPILNFPVLQEFSVRTRYFFIPNRVLCLMFSQIGVDTDTTPRTIWKKNTAVLDYSETPWEHFITGGKNGDDLISERTLSDAFAAGWTDNGVKAITKKGTLWDYFGFVPSPQTDSGHLTFANWKASYADLCFWKAFFCYNGVWNAYFRNENFQDERLPVNSSLAQVNFGKDRFTAALAEQQRGVAPQLSINWQDLPVGVYNRNDTFVPLGGEYFESSIDPRWLSTMKDSNGKLTDVLWSGSTAGWTIIGQYTAGDYLSHDSSSTEIRRSLLAKVPEAALFDVSDLRLMFQTQKYLEMNERVGYRYVEQLQARFGVRPQDSRIDRPLYLGGTSQSVIISQVTSTSDKTTSGGDSGQLGQFRGNGISASYNKGVVLRAKEHGWIFAVVYVTPKAVYGQRTDPQFFKKTRYDYYLPEFAHLSEQPVYMREVWPFTTTPDEVFGFQGIYDEYRSKMDMVCGNFRQGGNLSAYTCQRSWSTKPTLSSSFLTVPNYRNLFVSSSEDDPPLYFHCRNMNLVYRKLPKYATPGLVDHA